LRKRKQALSANLLCGCQPLSFHFKFLSSEKGRFGFDITHSQICREREAKKSLPEGALVVFIFRAEICVSSERLNRTLADGCSLVKSISLVSKPRTFPRHGLVKLFDGGNNNFRRDPSWHIAGTTLARLVFSTVPSWGKPLTVSRPFSPETGRIQGYQTTGKYVFRQGYHRIIEGVTLPDSQDELFCDSILLKTRLSAGADSISQVECEAHRHDP
jgi:hypothetical protein